MRVEEVKKAAVATIARTLLDKVAPACGKPIREMTKADCAAEGGWYMRLAEKLGAKETVGEAGLTDDQLWDLWSSGRP